ncbi:MAG: hypothetical protein ACYSUX_18145 [Planctomycetota bacterium]
MKTSAVVLAHSRWGVSIDYCWRSLRLIARPWIARYPPLCPGLPGPTRTA